jgi:outer membrane lipoprotein SlyB
MRSKIIITFLCIASVSILTTGCLSTTQKGAVIGAGAGTATGTMVGTFTGNTAMGAALGAGVGAVGGALVGDHLDKKREEQEKAKRYRQLELEKQKSSVKKKKYAKSHTMKRMSKIPREDKRIIKKYLNGLSVRKKYKVKKKSLPPGLAKKLARGGTLPPGWQKKVARGEVMGYEVYNNANPLPEELLRRLSTIPRGTVLLQVGNKIVKVIEVSREIVDLFEI